MSRKDGHLRVSGTRIEILGYTKQNVIHPAIHGRCITLPSMAAHLPYLPGSPSVSRRVLTSFVPPAHNQGVSLAPLQGRALWTKFLPTTGSFFVVC